MKKLVKRKAAVFQMGISYGHYLAIIQVGQIKEHNLKTLEDIINIKKHEFNDMNQHIYSLSEYIDSEFYEKIKERWSECHENINICVETYNNKMTTLSQDILHYLQLYS